MDIVRVHIVCVCVCVCVFVCSWQTFSPDWLHWSHCLSVLQDYQFDQPRTSLFSSSGRSWEIQTRNDLIVFIETSIPLVSVQTVVTSLSLFMTGLWHIASDSGISQFLTKQGNCQLARSGCTVWWCLMFLQAPQSPRLVFIVRNSCHILELPSCENSTCSCKFLYTSMTYRKEKEIFENLSNTAMAKNLQDQV